MGVREIFCLVMVGLLATLNRFRIKGKIRNPRQNETTVRDRARTRHGRTIQAVSLLRARLRSSARGINIKNAVSSPPAVLINGQRDENPKADNDEKPAPAVLPKEVKGRRHGA